MGQADKTDGVAAGKKRNGREPRAVDSTEGPETLPQKVKQPKLDKIVAKNEPDDNGMGAARSQTTSKLQSEEVQKVPKNITELAGGPSHFFVEEGKLVFENSAFNNRTKKAGYLKFYYSHTGAIHGFQCSSKGSGVLIAEFDAEPVQAKFSPVQSRREFSTYKDDAEQAALAEFFNTAMDTSNSTRNRLSILFVGDTALKASSSLQPTLRRIFEDREFKAPFGAYRQPAIVVLFNGSLAACVGEPAKTLHMRCSERLDKASIETYSEAH